MTESLTDTAADPAARAGASPGAPGFWKRVADSDLAHAFSRSPLTVLAALVTLLMALAAVVAPWLAPTDPYDTAALNLMNGFTPPMTANMFTGESFLLGTDNQGRDMVSAILYGLRISLFVGVMAVALAMVIGITVGLVAGYVGGWVDAVAMRIADIQLTFPSILVAMLIFGVAKGFSRPSCATRWRSGC